MLESSTTYPLLLSLFVRRAVGAINSNQLIQCIDMLRGFILRRFVCGESSRGYGQMFVRALAKDAGDPVKTLETYLLERGWPDDRQFKSAFVEFPLYQRGYTREVLESLERARGHKEPADLEATQVEHVLPQTLNEAWLEDLGPEAESIHAEWLHRPGNLTLSAYNLALWNHPFKIKRQHYAQSNIGITRELAEYESWPDVECRERGERLGQEAARLWIGPEQQIVRSEADDGDDEGPGRQELRRRFWSGLSDYLAVEYPEIPNFEIRPSWNIRLPSGLRHIGFEVVFNLRRQHVGIDVWFWREASRPVWEQIQESPKEFSALVGAEWEFEPVEGRHRARMFINHPNADLRNELSWAEMYRWLGEKLSLLYEQIAPNLRAAMDRNASL
jgi:Protein of unknown function (DUF1524)/Domain of unknown function (DUF4268)